MTEIEQKSEEVSDEIIAPPDTGYRWKHLIVAAVVIGVGGWFAYDGWIKWPATNARSGLTSSGNVFRKVSARGPT